MKKCLADDMVPDSEIESEIDNGHRPTAQSAQYSVPRIKNVTDFRHGAPCVDARKIATL